MKRILIAIWIISYLVLIDIVVNYVFRYPEDPHNIHPSFMQTYFEYGRSVEGKLDRMTRRTDEESAPIVAHGWLESKKYAALPSTLKNEGEILVAVYGMSHIGLLGDAIAKCDEQYVIRKITAPGAPANWSFGVYELDRKFQKADVVILGIMTDNIACLSATSGGTFYFDMSYPYTFPRYIFNGNELKAKYPPFHTVEDYRRYFYDEHRWQDYRKWLESNDKYLDPLLFYRSVVDKSSFVRILRRAYADKMKQKKIAGVYTIDGFNESSEEVKTLKGIIRAFARLARESGSIPIIYIVNNQGRSDHLFKVLKPVLDKDKIPYLSTHVICPPDDPRVFLSANSHFTPSKDLELAREIIGLIHAESEKGKRTKGF